MGGSRKLPMITANNTPDGHWVYFPESSTPAESTFGSPSLGAATPLQTVGPGDSGWWTSWAANGPTSDWININPNSATGNTFGLYYTTFNISGSSVPANLCLVGSMGVDDNGLLAINGTAIMSNLNVDGANGFYGGYSSLYPLSIPVSTYLTTGTNVLALGWGGTDNNLEAFRLGATIQTCGASQTGGLTFVGSKPATGTTGVAVNTTATLNFNNALDPATVNSNTLLFTIGQSTNQDVAGTYQVNGSQVIFTPDSPLPTNTTVWAYITNGVRDIAGDSINGQWLTNFTTGGTAIAAPAPFAVAAFSPANNSTNAGLRTQVTATFNRSVNTNSINPNAANADMGLFAGDGQSPWCTSVSRSQDNTSVWFNCYALPSSTTMTAILNSGLSDWQGNALTPFTSQFTTAYYDSNTNGSIVTTRPGNGASGINVNQPITIYTSLPINAATANSGLQVAENNVAVTGTVAVLDNGYTLEFTPSSPWTPGALIQWWTTGSLLDSTYETPINSGSGYFYAAASTGSLAPVVQTTSPSQYANTGNPIPLNSIFDIQFNVPLNASTVTATNVYLYDQQTTLNVAATLSMPQPNEIRITPTSALPSNHYIFVELTTGLQSTTSVPLASNTNWYDYTGTAADSTVPTIVSAVPYNGATGVGVNASPGVVISKPIDPVSINSSTFTLANGGTAIAGGFSLNSSNTRVSFVPNAPLPASTPITMTLNGVLDQEGHPLNFSSTFTTGASPDFTAPSVVWSSVNSNESVPTNSEVTVQFSESMDLTSFTAGQPGACSNFYIYDYLQGTCIATTLTWNSSQTIAYLVPTAPLSAGRQYELVVYGGTDLSGNQVNAFEPGFYAEFTAATAAPTVINYNPLSGATGLGTNAIIEAQFSGPIDPTTVGGVTLTSSSGTVTTSTSVGSGDTVLQLIPAVPLAPNTTYTMHIVGVKDPAGHTVATSTNTFTTGATYDVTNAPAISSDPVNNTTVGINVTPKIVFNKALNPITVNTSTFNMYLYDTGQYIPATVAPSANGTEVTITPLIPLLPNTRYHFRACCGFQDEDGNNGSGVDLYFWTNGGAATSGPTVTVSPANTATGVPTNAQIYATISAPIDPTTWSQSSIQLLQGSTPIAGTGALPGAQTLTFTPTAALSPSTVYTVKVSGFTDANGNAVVPSTTTFTTGTVAATGGLLLTSTSIVNGSNVTNNLSPITLTFSQPLNPLTAVLGNILVTNSQNTNWGLAGTFAVNGNAITFTPSSPYPPNATIWVYISTGLTDLAGNSYSSSAWALNFTTTGDTGDTTPLTVMSVNPASGATNVRPDVPVSVTFNKGINPYSVYNNNNNALLFSGQGLQDRGSISMSADNRTLTFNSGTLYTGTQYTIQLPAGGITDPSGNALATTFSSTFTTGTNPVTGNGGVKAIEPGANSTGNPTNTLLTLFLNRQVNTSTLPGNVVVTVNGAVYPGNVVATASNYEVQYTPSTPFPAGATVQWWFSALGTVLDVNGDPINGDSGTFYTAAAVNPATAQPVVLSVSPTCCNSLDVPTNSNVDIQFSQPIDATTLAGNVYLNTGPSTPTFSVGLAPGTTNVVRITPSSPWTASTQYGFCVNGSVKGTNGVAAQSSCWATYFTTTAGTDTTPGTITLGPPNGSTGVGTNAYFRVQFSKPVDRAWFNAGYTGGANWQALAGGNPIPGTWSFNYNGNDLLGANFSPVNPLPPSSTISLSLSGVEDYAGNTFPTVTSTFTTAALPDYSQPTATLDFNNTPGNIGTNASFTCRYSEAMDPSSINQSNTHIWSQVANGFIPVNYTWSSDLMSVTMTPVTPLFANSYYYYQCDGGIDLTGNGLNNSYAYFYTGAGPVAVGPSLVYANPPSGATNIPLNSIGGPWNNTSLMLLFNVPVSTESMANITFTPQGGSAEPIAVYPEDGNYIADVQMPWTLAPSTKYTFNFAGVTDLNGNPAQGTTTSFFTTGTGFDWANPTATAATPANNTTTAGVNPVISLTFSTLMNPVLITSSQIYLRTHNTQTTVPSTLAISVVGGVTVVTVTPTTPLAQSTIYDLMYWPNNWYLYDVAGNYEAQYGVETTFTTGTTAAVNGACGTANGASFSTAPSANLCSAGTASAVTNPGSWSWTCNGQYTGTNASCSATVTGTPACVAQFSSLQGLWSGNDSPNDSSANGYNGTLENGVAYGLGEAGDAFDLTGNNGTTDEYVLIGQPVPTNLQIQNAITLSAWIYPTQIPNPNYSNGGGALGLIIGSQHDGNTAGATIFFDGNTNSQGITGIPPGHIQFQIGNGSWHEYDTTTQLPLNQWTLITATRTATNPAQIYYNGVLQPSVTSESAWNGTISYPSGAMFAIGQQNDYNRPFVDLINEAQIYNAALTQAQITAIYNAGRGGICP